MDLDVRLRYLPIIKEISSGSVLEVGSGSRGIARFLPWRVTGCDVTFNEEPLSNLDAIVGSVLDLPFNDNSFDYVVSSDMLEHLSFSDREKAILEMIRVTRQKIIFGVPCGKKSNEYERRLFNLFKRVTGKEHRWLKEHLANGLPEEEELVGYAKNYPINVKGNVNLYLWFLNELFNPWFWFVPWILYPLFLFNGKTTYRKIFIISKL